MPNRDLATRAQAVTMKVLDLPNHQIEQILGISRSTVNRWFQRAKQRGFDPLARPCIIQDHHVVDGARTGRPTKQTPENINAVVTQVCTDRYGREKSCEMIADQLNMSEMTVWRILNAAGYSKTKPTCKPGLSERMRAQRLAFALKYKDWTLEDWKNVIWSDETSVVLNHRRGGSGDYPAVTGLPVTGLGLRGVRVMHGHRIRLHSGLRLGLLPAESGH